METIENIFIIVTALIGGIVYLIILIFILFALPLFIIQSLKKFSKSENLSPYLKVPIWIICTIFIFKVESYFKDGKSWNGDVYVCTGAYSTVYHRSRYCDGLKACKSEINLVDLDVAKNQMRRRYCEIESLEDYEDELDYQRYEFRY